MPCPHNEITIVQRSQRQSAVAAAAYQSGEKLFCEYDHSRALRTRKSVVSSTMKSCSRQMPTGICRPQYFMERRRSDGKAMELPACKAVVLTIPREIPPDQYAVLVREFCEQQFVSKGMIADFAIHDPYPPGHNPHAHVLLTMRAMDEHGKWLPKSRKVYDLDENGERIKLPSGRWKSHKEDTVDWNAQKYCEIWRHEWEVIQNRYLEANDRPERVDLRSYARQGLDVVPTVHEGAAVRQMEKRGIQTNIGNLNREIRAANRLMKSIRQLIQNLKGWITELAKNGRSCLHKKRRKKRHLSQSADEVYGDTKGRTEGLDKGWTEPGDFTGLKGSQRSPVLSPSKGAFYCGGLRSISGIFRKSAADYRSQMKPKEARSNAALIVGGAVLCSGKRGSGHPAAWYGQKAAGKQATAPCVRQESFARQCGREAFPTW